MFDFIEDFLKSKILNKDKNWWTKVVGALSLVGLGLFLYVRYRVLKDNLYKAELENILVDDYKQDAILKAKQEAIEKARAEALQKANQHQAKAQDIEKVVQKVEAQGKTDQETIKNIDSWEELDRTIKEKP